jgi:hypothetical protein
MGAEYTRDSFLRTPLKEIYAVLEFSFEEEKRRANIDSISTAKLALIVMQVAQGLAGSKAPNKLSIDDILPFALNESVSQQQTETTEIINKLVRSGQLPVHVIAALSKVVSLK